jgi:hypothetical protein
MEQLLQHPGFTPLLLVLVALECWAIRIHMAEAVTTEQTAITPLTSGKPRQLEVALVVLMAQLPLVTVALAEVAGGIKLGEVALQLPGKVMLAVLTVN